MTRPAVSPGVTGFSFSGGKCSGKSERPSAVATAATVPAISASVWYCGNVAAINEPTVAISAKTVTKRFGVFTAHLGK
jgi:hypothetical protein